jgi:hypothetical protein
MNQQIVNCNINPKCSLSGTCHQLPPDNRQMDGTLIRFHRQFSDGTASARNPVGNCA